MNVDKPNISSVPEPVYTIEPARYVWVEVYDIELNEEVDGMTRGWPDTSTLQEKIDAEKAKDPSPHTSHLMRREQWERRINAR